MSRVRQLKNSIRRVRHLFRAMTGKDVHIRSQMRCNKLWLGDDNAQWCICPTGLSEKSVVYSFGVGTDISFDLELIREFRMRVHAFDPTPRSIKWVQAKEQELPEEFVFHDFGVADSDGLTDFYPPENPNYVSYSVISARDKFSGSVRAPVHRLSTIMKMLGHEQIDLLKFDVEGAEYGVVGDFLASQTPVRQLLVEFHHRWPEVGLKKTREAVEQLNRSGFRLFNVSPSGEEFSFLKD